MACRETPPSERYTPGEPTVFCWSVVNASVGVRPTSSARMRAACAAESDAARDATRSARPGTRSPAASSTRPSGVTLIVIAPATTGTSPMVWRTYTCVTPLRRLVVSSVTTRRATSASERPWRGALFWT